MPWEEVRRSNIAERLPFYDLTSLGIYDCRTTLLMCYCDLWIHYEIVFISSTEVTLTFTYPIRMSALKKCDFGSNMRRAAETAASSLLGILSLAGQISWMTSRLGKRRVTRRPMPDHRIPAVDGDLNARAPRLRRAHCLAAMHCNPSLDDDGS